MFIDGVYTVGTHYHDGEYIFHFHETYESGKFYYLRMMHPILKVFIEHSHMTSYLTYRTDISTKGSFRGAHTQDGIDYEIINVGHQKDKFVICNNDNIEEKFEEFLEMFIDKGLYKEIPEIQALMKDYPNLLI